MENCLLVLAVVAACLLICRICINLHTFRECHGRHRSIRIPFETMHKSTLVMQSTHPDRRRTTFSISFPPTSDYSMHVSTCIVRVLPSSPEYVYEHCNLYLRTFFSCAYFESSIRNSRCGWPEGDLPLRKVNKRAREPVT